MGAPTKLDVQRGAAVQRSVSKLLSFWLRHRPDAASLMLDEEGWGDSRAVLAALNNRGIRWSMAQLRALVEANDQQRFELSPDVSRIRARQGQSVRG